MPPSIPLSESDVVRQIRDFLQHRQWRMVRMQRTVVPGQFQSGEPGMADAVFLRYVPTALPGSALILWCEFKSPNDRRKCRCAQIQGTRKQCGVCLQKRWRERERSRGALVWTVNDFIWFEQEYSRTFGWLHAPGTGVGQLDLLASSGV